MDYTNRAAMRAAPKSGYLASFLDYAEHFVSDPELRQFKKWLLLYPLLYLKTNWFEIQ